MTSIEPVPLQPGLTEPEREDLERARVAYEAGAVRLVAADLGGFSHLVASRQGLFAVEERRCSLVAEGYFFGITLDGPSIYVFESCDLPRSRTRRGRIVRLLRDGDLVVRGDVVVEDLDNGCHQIDLIDGRLCILDTYNQRLLRCRPDGSGKESLHPLPPGPVDDWEHGYAHVNSLLQAGGRNLLLLHNGGVRTGRQSTIAVCDREWRFLESWTLPGEGCHNLAALEDGTLLSCASLSGEVISLDGLRVRVSGMMTRGLSVGADSIAVGASTFSSRRHRHLVPGTVTFLDREFGLRAVLDLPGAPTDIRRLDGRDSSLSNCVGQNVPALKPRPGSTVRSATG